MRISDWSSDVCSSDLNRPQIDASLRQKIIVRLEARRYTFELVTQAHEPRRSPYEFTIRLPAPHSRLRADGGPGRGVRPSQGNPFRRASTQAANRRPGFRSVRWGGASDWIASGILLCTWRGLLFS